MILHVVGPITCVPTRKDGVPEFVIKTQYCHARWPSDTISKITCVVISQIVSLHHCTTILGFDDEFWGDILSRWHHIRYHNV